MKDVYKEKIEALSLLIRELKYVRKFLETTINKFFIGSWSCLKDIDVDYTFIPTGHNEDGDQYYVYRNKKILNNLYKDINNKVINPYTISDIIRYNLLKETLKKINKDIEERIKEYNITMKEYKNSLRRKYG